MLRLFFLELNKCKKIKIMQSTFSEHNEIKLEIKWKYKCVEIKQNTIFLILF